MCSQNKGFTLIEIIVAVAIFAVIASIVFPALVQFLDMRERIEEKNNGLIGLQKTFLFLAKDLRYAANRLGKDEFGEVGKTTMSLNDDSLIDFTAVYPDASLQGLSVPRRIRWVLEEGTLKRIQFPVMDPEQETRAIVQTLLVGVEEVEIEVSHIEDGRDNSDDKWEEQSKLPDLISFGVTLQSGVEYQRLFTMLGADNRLAAAASADSTGSLGSGGAQQSGSQPPDAGDDIDLRDTDRELVQPPDS